MEFMEKLTEIQHLFGELSTAIPEPTKAYMELIERVMKTGNIPVKYKELIFISLSLVQKCDWCVAYHLRIARENGVTEDELNEAAFIALLMGGTPALMESIKLKKYLDEIKSSS